MPASCLGTPFDTFMALRGYRWYWLDDEPLGGYGERPRELKHQAFSKGQLLVLEAATEREVGCGAKPSKWGSLDDGTPIRRSEVMRYKLFTKLVDAVAEVNRVKDLVKTTRGADG